MAFIVRLLFAAISDIVVGIYGGLIDYLAKRECDAQICSHAKTLNHVAI